MTTSVPARDAPSVSVPSFARTPVGLIAAVVGVYHLVLGALGRGLYFDESLMLAIGRHHLDWGSADQPPLTPALAALADAVAPGVNGVLRLVPSLATAAAVVVAALIARELGGDRRAQTLTALAQATGVWVTMTGHFVAPYVLEPVQWLVIVWLLVRWMRLRDDRLLLVLGPVLGLAALTKFQVMLFAVVLVVAVLVAGPRDLLRRPAFWAAAVIAALIATPTLVWQALRGWPQLEMGAVVAGESVLFGGPVPNAVLMVLFAGVAGTVLLVAGVLGTVTDPRLRPYRFLTLAFLLLWIFFAVTVGRAYYLDGIHGAIAAVGAVWFQHRREAGHRRLSWAAWPGGVLAVLVAATTFGLSTAFTAPDIPQRITDAVAGVYDALPPEQRERTVVYGESYIYSSYVDTFGSASGLPQAYGGNRAYGYFAPPPDDHDSVVFLGKDPSTLAPTGVVLRQAADLGDGTRVWVGDGMRRPWSAVWPELRTLQVS
ncbi:glycosyl transferase family 39 [Pseudonocardia sp. EC080610-09]|uniref:glycosyltransferase family 39 protein n=1 Tax=unclassified Pseudonocardia TaxID=2619320 RepID=UPI0006CB0EDC|nr:MULTISPECIES: glycosyltransferase family 39 protein [unclassified Pseudonocardia]ALE74430.1 glycosyl transferase family 39 [Pseudonocardia sp. EC080625-04]ALL77851.1 glycosyl transferase family 39 [Pseudonocardia sp. EC080610-09]ALL80766.1 glycosyl transferase family 39 [Pseudonocardia sp. EC080619-01]